MSISLDQLQTSGRQSFEASVAYLTHVGYEQFLSASNDVYLSMFLSIVMPMKSPLGGVAARILETGAEFATTKEKPPWAPRWSAVPLTKKTGDDWKEVAVKQIFYRIHDSLHQLWGIPTPCYYTEEERNYFKRVQMSGEVAVLGITEFYFGILFWEAFPELRTILERRRAVGIWEYKYFDRQRLHEVVIWLDDVLHTGRNNPLPSRSRNADFIKDYQAMLQRDRDQIDLNWTAMKAVNWSPGATAPRDMLPPGMCGLELAVWMASDFLRLLGTSPWIDVPLRNFNMQRRALIKLPENWAS